jgi:hypothetical protein
MTTSYFFHYPLDFREPTPVSADCKELSETKHKIADFISDQCILAEHLSEFASDGTQATWKSVKDKADSFMGSANELDARIMAQPELFNAINTNSYTNFRQLIDRKRSIASEVSSYGSSPPADHASFEKKATDLKNLAKRARDETADLNIVSLCPSPPARTSAGGPCN